MKNKTRPVTVRILDKDYMVACPEGEQDALTASAQRVDKEMRRIRDSGKVLGTDRIAVMVALNLAHEILMQDLSAPADNLMPATLTSLQDLQQRMDLALAKHKA